MCNLQSDKVPVSVMRQAFDSLDLSLSFPEGIPNLEPRSDIGITDSNAIIRAAPGGGAELVVRRWSWPDERGKPVYNFRSDGREFARGRCLIVADAFYEFTAPPKGAPRGARKTRWQFTMANEPWFCIAGIWRTHPEIGEAYTMLTTTPGPDIAPYHHRQVVVLGRRDWARWLDYTIPASDVLGPAPAGTLAVGRCAGEEPAAQPQLALQP
ncbi:SOS response-associated peptidase family protein [Sphingomonas quercus]|uniref:Abasic site processing protein n=1 Tax=Sphingomonas quercus TaxID=2842451 RepID=A0ABS6BDP4_9SPHN|nr:SOS response-associated peptidase family protein [Sphingomonas quercus]MBU3076440.1 SOS response-associated peptidase family protein [Sphingomonas quercus]